MKNNKISEVFSTQIFWQHLLSYHCFSDMAKIQYFSKLLCDRYWYH